MRVPGFQAFAEMFAKLFLQQLGEFARRWVTVIAARQRSAFPFELGEEILDRLPLGELFLESRIDADLLGAAAEPNERFAVIACRAFDGVEAFPCGAGPTG
jgi:hypothetical protein